MQRIIVYSTVVCRAQFYEAEMLKPVSPFATHNMPKMQLGAEFEWLANICEFVDVNAATMNDNAQLWVVQSTRFGGRGFVFH